MKETTSKRVSLADARLVERLLARDELAYAELVTRYHNSMVRVASKYVPDTAIAEEVTQDTWVAVYKGLHGFRGTGSLRAWIYMILKNKARQRGVREARTALGGTFDREFAASTRLASRTIGDDGDTQLEPRHSSTPERVLVARETLRVIDGALQTLTAAQRETVVQRDVLGASSGEVCAYLQVSQVNQRVLLHRGRGCVRGAVEAYLRAS